jgi:glucose-6-phosphate 1-dehydrogenase
MSTLVQPVPQKIEIPTLPQGDSCLVVIFGATGDLTRRKLIPALYDLACVGCTTRNFQVLGIGRTKLNDDELRERLHDGAATSKDARSFTEEGWRDFADRLHYLVGDANQPDFYPHLKAKIQELQKNGASKNVLFYVSVSASLAPPIVEGLGQAGLARNSEGWTRIILEKPFGTDLKSAQQLNEMVSRVFDEHSVYRIDHYLGKETVQNIMMFRFGNSIFEPVWNRNYVE